MENLAVKLNILMDVTDKKLELLNSVYSITENQETILKTEELPDKNSFLNESVDEKQKLIDEIITSDEVFQSMYDEIKDELKSRTKEYSDFIFNLQIKVKEAIDLDVKIRVKEKYNSDLKIFKPASKSHKASKKYILEQYTSQNNFGKKK